MAIVNVPKSDKIEELRLPVKAIMGLEISCQSDPPLLTGTISTKSSSLSKILVKARASRLQARRTPLFGFDSWLKLSGLWENQSLLAGTRSDLGFSVARSLRAKE
jgi:hypothetical protein